MDLLTSAIPDIQQQLRTAYRLPVHVLYRLAALVAGEPVDYVDCALESAGAAGWTGQVVIFTQSRLIRAELRGARDCTWENDESTSTVTMSAHPRRGLVATLAGPDIAWYQDWDGWPWHAQVEVQYGGADPIVLPMRSDERQVETFNAFFPGLLWGGLRDDFGGPRS